MTALRAVLIDDDPKNSQILALKIRQITQDVEIVGVFDRPTDALVQAAALRPDVLFIDIDMPIIDGFSLAQQLMTQINAKVVFVTAYSQYTLRALRLSAFDYLTKPVEPDDLRQTLTRLQASILPFARTEERLSQLELLMQHLQPNPKIPSSTIALPTLESIQFVPVSDIMQIEASSNYSIFYLKDKSSIMVSKTLKEYEESLPSAQFTRANRSTIVNLAYVKAYMRRDGGYLVLQNGTEITISPNRKDDILLKLQHLF